MTPGIISRINRAVVPALMAALMAAACGNPGASSAVDAPPRKKLTEIADGAAFERLVAAAGNRLLLIEFYADWCAPCKQLEPLLERMAWEERERADFYKINLDSNRPLAELFRVRGIPYVALVKNRTIVYSLMGLRDKEAYRDAIRSFAGDAAGTDGGDAQQRELGRLPAPQPPDQQSQRQGAGDS